MSLTHGQYNLIAKFVEAQLTTFTEAEAAFERQNSGQIEAWKKRLTRLGIRSEPSEATGYYDRHNIARKR